jgi:hypothetical protein
LVGLVAHATDSDGRPRRRGRPSVLDRLADAILRGLIVEWLAEHEALYRLGTALGRGVRVEATDDAAWRAALDARVQRVRDVLPCRDAAGRLTMGEFGGDGADYGAAADLFGCALFTFRADASADAAGVLYSPGVQTNGRRGHCAVATVQAALETCIKARWQMLVLANGGLHWRAWAPCNSSGALVIGPTRIRALRDRITDDEREDATERLLRAEGLQATAEP